MANQKLKNEIRELIVKDGRYLNLFEGAKQPSLLGMVDAGESWRTGKVKPKESKEAKKRALKKALKFKKEGWKNVSIRGLYSYPDFKNPFRYDIEAWGGFS